MASDGALAAGISVGLVPFDAGRAGWRMGAGPDELFDDGLRLELERRGLGVRITSVGPGTDWGTELRTTFDLHHRVAEHVQDAVRAGSPPVVVAGDCSVTVGVVAGLGAAERVGVLWLDAHADFETPETDPSGYLDGQGLAMVTGRCWTAHTASLAGFVPVPDARVLLVGARDLGEAEEADLQTSGVRRLAADATAEELDRTVAAWAEDVDRIHVHVDVDVLDASYGRTNDWASSGGMSADGVLAVIRSAAAARPVASVVLASWDPAADPNGAVREPLRRIVLALLGALDDQVGPRT
jgi:arginase